MLIFRALLREDDHRGIRGCPPRNVHNSTEKIHKCGNTSTYENFRQTQLGHNPIAEEASQPRRKGNNVRRHVRIERAHNPTRRALFLIWVATQADCTSDRTANQTRKPL